MSHDIFLQGWELQRRGYITDALECYTDAILTRDKCAIFHWNCMDKYGQDIPINVNNSFDLTKLKLSDDDFYCLYDCYRDIDEVEILYNLGLLYFYNKSKEWGIYYWSIGARRNYPPAHVSLGSYYIDLKQYHLAFTHFRIATSYNYYKAFSWMGICYSEGFGINKNEIEAFKYFSLASQQKSAYAQYRLGFLYQYGTMIERNDNMALYYYYLASEYEPEAQAQLGLCYNLGHGVEQNYEEAIRWYELAIKGGSSNAMNNYATMFLHGHGVPQNYNTAIELYSKAIDNGNKEAIANLNNILSLPSKIRKTLDNYIGITDYQEISYIFFSEFLSYLSRELNIVELYDSSLRSWITDSLMDYFLFLDPHFSSITIDHWFEDFYLNKSNSRAIL